MESIKDKQKGKSLYTLKEFAEELHSKLEPLTDGKTKPTEWKNNTIPISRGTYYTLGRGILPTKDTIEKVCDFLKRDMPQIFF